MKGVRFTLYTHHLKTTNTVIVYKIDQVSEESNLEINICTQDGIHGIPRRMPHLFHYDLNIIYDSTLNVKLGSTSD